MSKKRARSTKVTRTFSYDRAADRDIEAWLETQPNASDAVRAAIRAAIGGQQPPVNVTLADVYRAVQELKELVTRPGASASSGDEPPDVADALDGLGL